MEEQISATTSERNLAISCKVKVTLHPSNSKHTCVRRRTLPTKFHVVKAMVFSVVMYGCEYSGLISFRIDWFDLLAVQETLKGLL